MNIHSFTFSKEDFDPKYNTITLKMGKRFFIDELKHRKIEQVEIVSPTGKKMTFTNPHYIIGGTRYYCDKINLKLMYEL